MKAMIVVVVLPFTQFLVKQVDVVGDAVLIKQLVDLLVVNAVQAFVSAVWLPVDRIDTLH